jgi:hypothetical protein
MVPIQIPPGGSVRGGAIFAADGTLWGCCGGGNICGVDPTGGATGQSAR